LCLNLNPKLEELIVVVIELIYLFKFLAGLKFWMKYTYIYINQIVYVYIGSVMLV